MLSHYLKTSLRAFRRTKTHTLVNLLGLTLGLLCATLIFQKLRYEASFDQHHPNAEQTFRVVHESTEFGNTSHQRGIAYPFAATFREEMPEADLVVLIDRNFGRPVIAVEQEDGEVARFRERGTVAIVEPGFFELFDYDWLAGDRATALDGPYTIVLSETLTAKYFGDDAVPTDVIGRVVTFDNDFELTVTGVVTDPIETNSLPMHALVSANLGEEHTRINDNWGSVSSGVQTYVRLPEGVDPETVNAKLVDFVGRHYDEDDSGELTYFLQPLTAMHFDDRFGSENGGITTPGEMYTLGLIGLLLLLTACINFVNLNTTLVFRRAKEVGVRKALGGTPREIRGYFMTETALLTAIALVVALLLANPVRLLISDFFGESFAVNPFTDPLLLAFVLGAGLLLTLASGLYPAWLMSRLRASEVVKGQVSAPGGFLSVRRGLVVVQFAISQVLIIGTLAAVYQTQYLRSAPLGYDTSAVVEFEIPDNTVDLATLATRLEAHSAIDEVTFSNSGATSGSTWAGNFHYEKDTTRIENNAQIKLVEEDYLRTYRMPLVAGRDFVRGDSSSFIINEALAELMGYENPADALDTPIDMWNWEGVVTGVVRDFNTNSLHQEIDPTVLVVAPDYAYVGAARIQMNQRTEALDVLEAAWTDTFPAFVYDYGFLDDNIANFYQGEESFQRIINAFALVAILIGCIGLFGLVSYTTARRAKEVGVRKVLGASTGHIVARFAREFVVLVLLGFAVASPLAFVMLRAWLEDFAYRIDLGPGLFALGLAASLTLALVTVGVRTYRAASADPARVLRAQ
ncbi:MAG: FtsX-like permease family protein [Bacteroidota bacterium]